MPREDLTLSLTDGKKAVSWQGNHFAWGKPEGDLREYAQAARVDAPRILSYAARYDENRGDGLSLLLGLIRSLCTSDGAPDGRSAHPKCLAASASECPSPPTNCRGALARQREIKDPRGLIRRWSTRIPSPLHALAIYSLAAANLRPKGTWRSIVWSASSPPE
jgi:hypothetical protein